MATISAHFDGQHFVPDEPVVALRPGDRVEVVPVPQSAAPIQDSSQWEQTLLHAIQLHPTAKHVADDSRGSIYAGRGE